MYKISYFEGVLALERVDVVSTFQQYTLLVFRRIKILCLELFRFYVFFFAFGIAVAHYES